MRLAFKKLYYLIALSLFVSSAHAQITSIEASEKDSAIAILLTQATKQENINTTNSYWEAAKMYCEASRHGSIEAQYRLGMLYAYGKGVAKNRNYAATLFSSASRQGHHEAGSMLELINFSSEVFPPCVEEDVLPEKSHPADMVSAEETIGIDHYISKLPKEQKWMIDLASTTAEWYEIDPKLVISVIAIESGFKEHALSNANAMGMMQLIPATAQRFNVKNAFNAAQNIKGGVRYLRWLLNYYLGDTELAIAAYNAGEKAVDRYKGTPPYKETRDYVQKFRSLYKAKTQPYSETTEISPLKSF